MDETADEAVTPVMAEGTSWICRRVRAATESRCTPRPESRDAAVLGELVVGEAGGHICWRVPRLTVGYGRNGEPGREGPDREPGHLGRFATFTFNDGEHGAGLEDRLRSIVAILNDGG